MPREAVYGTTVGVVEGGGDDPDRVMSDAEFEREIPIAEVRWQKWPVCHVQVVTRRKGYEISPEEPITYEYGMYVDLDRDAINRFIRNLRRARDQAFGRDE